MKLFIPVFLTFIAFHNFSFAGAKDGGAASTCTKNNKVSIADLCFELQHGNSYKPSEDLKKNIERILKNSAPFYKSIDELTLESNEFLNQIYGETKEFFLVDKLPKNCEQLDPDKMGDNVKIHELACTKGYKVFLVKKELAKLDSLQLSLALIHEGIHGFSQTEGKYIDHSDIALIVKALNLIETIYIPAVESMNTEEIFNQEQVSILKSLSKVLFHFFDQYKLIDVGLDKRGIISNIDLSKLDKDELIITTGSQLYLENTDATISFENVKIENSKLRLGEREDKGERFLFKNIVLTNSNFNAQVSADVYSSLIKNSIVFIGNITSSTSKLKISLSEIKTNDSFLGVKLVRYEDPKSPPEPYQVSKVRLDKSSLEIDYPFGNEVNHTSDIYLDNGSFMNLKGGSKKITVLDSKVYVEENYLSSTYFDNVNIDKSSNMRVNGNTYLSNSRISASSLEIGSSELDKVDILNSNLGDISIKKKNGQNLIIDGVFLDEKNSNNRIMYHALKFENAMTLSNMDIVTEKCHGKLVFSNKKAESWDGSGSVFAPKDSTGVFTSKGFCEFSTFDKLKKYEVE